MKKFVACSFAQTFPKKSSHDQENYESVEGPTEELSTSLDNNERKEEKIIKEEFEKKNVLTLNIAKTKVT